MIVQLVALALAALPLLAALAALGAYRFCFFARVWGTSMDPTLKDGERVLVRRRRKIAVGDVVVFRLEQDVPLDPTRPSWDQEPTLWIKRVAAVAGDPVPSWLTAPGSGNPSVPPGKFVVIGDNAASVDSNKLGFVPIETVVGVLARDHPKVRR
jgi:signal peptidase I